MKIEKKYFILLLFLLLGTSALKAHPFYVSICQVDFNSKTQSLEIALKVFADDLLQGLEKEGKTKLYLGEERENPKTDQYIFDYLKSQINFAVNNEKVQYNFIGKELENGVVWMYFEVENVSRLNTFEVENTLLTEVIESQNNIVQVNKNGVIKNLLLNKNKTFDTLVF
ncbi:hypothetical protein OU798_17745 [Prolixibacteraceae bacterium Z1-6]|uniref:Uncharacterized protein n=1 Tax=Draconibacterium aestuarii TaxID=2998507 RepID=A0A9X3J7P2_9BACT|nr:hypothetical protein [Prolixibacteraceae bacterium Z1-6]